MSEKAKRYHQLEREIFERENELHRLQGRMTELDWCRLEDLRWPTDEVLESAEPIKRWTWGYVTRARDGKRCPAIVVESTRTKLTLSLWGDHDPNWEMQCSPHDFTPSRDAFSDSVRSFCFPYSPIWDGDTATEIRTVEYGLDAKQ